MDFHPLILAAAQLAETAAQSIPATEAVEAAGHGAEPGILGTLGINWKLFLAQLVNFSIVLFVFWRWVVKPLGKTLTARQEKIESGLKNAEFMADEKAKFEAWHAEEMKKSRQEAERVLKSAGETADKIRQEATAAAQEQGARILDQAQTAIAMEKDKMFKEVRGQVAELVVLAAEKILAEKLDSKKDQELVVQTMKGLDK